MCKRAFLSTIVFLLLAFASCSNENQVADTQPGLVWQPR